MNTLKRIYFEEIRSTNEYAKTLVFQGQDVLLVAGRQTGGKGTKGRSFSSEVGGLYLTLVTFYENFPATQAFRIMQSSAAAVCETLKDLGLTPKIKWPNDVYVNGKKICGILIENALTGKNVSRSIVGIGLNVKNELPEPLQAIATSIKAETGKALDLTQVENLLIGHIRTQDIDKNYEKYVGWLGENVTLIKDGESFSARILSIDEQGGLRAIVNGEERCFSAAEISLRVE